MVKRMINMKPIKLLCHRSQTYRLSAYLFILGSTCHVAMAEDYLSMELEQLMQVTVAGSTLREESYKTVPSAVTVFTREQLARLGMDYLYEVLNLVPGYQFNRNADSPAGYTFSARGRRNSAEAREILLLVDGRVFSDPRTGGADGSLPLFPLEQIEKVEVIRGPGSALYGSSAFNGVINVVTRKGENSLKVDAGSQARRSARLLFSRTNDEWETNLFAAIYKDKGQDNFITDSFSGALLNSEDPRSTVNIDAGLRYGQTQLRAAYHRIATNGFYVGESTANGFNSYLQLFRQVSVEHALVFGENMKTDVALSYLDIEQNLSLMLLPAHYLSNLSQPASDDPMLAKGVFAGRTYRFSIANDWTINAKSSAQFGLDWHDDSETHAYALSNFDLTQLISGNFPIRYYGGLEQSTKVGREVSRKATGLYGQYLQDITEATRLTMGLRYDHYSGIGKHFSPRFGLVHQLTESQTIKLLYGEAYRAPSLSEMGVLNNPILVGNPHLSYEVVKTWDVIWMHTWHNSSISVDGFRNTYEDPIATAWIGATRTYVNGADERSEGIEVEANHQLNAQWMLRATYTHLFTLPESAFREAEHLTSIMVNYEVNHWNFNVAAIAHSERHTAGVPDNMTALDSYWLANSKSIYRLNKNTALHFQIKNVFNKHYATPTQGTGLPSGVPNRGREWSLGFDWSF